MVMVSTYNRPIAQHRSLLSLRPQFSPCGNHAYTYVLANMHMPNQSIHSSREAMLERWC